jgi:ATP-binding cassette subfamily F protein 3
VLLGKLIVSPANLLLLDEPTNHLDMESVDSLLEALEAFEGAVVIVTHSEMILHALPTRLIVFDDDHVKVFEGTYQDFLERDGWKDEGEGTALARQHAEKKGEGTDRKELKRMKAELIDRRSRILVPLTAKISEVEEEITRLERGMAQDTQALVDASVKGDGESIKRLSKSIHESRGKIDTLFDELETLTNELDIQSREFEERLASLQTAGGQERLLPLM